MKTAHNPWITAALAAVLVLLGTLAVSQHRWLDQIAQAQTAHLKDESQRRSRALAHAIDRAVTSLFIGARFDAAPVRKNDGAAFAAAVSRFRAENAHAGLLKKIYVWSPATKSLRAFDEPANAFAEVPWPGQLAAARDRLDPGASPGTAGAGGAARVSLGLGLVAGDEGLALIAPLTETLEAGETFGPPRDLGPGILFQHRSIDVRGVVLRSDAFGVAILEIDREALVDRVAKPALAEASDGDFLAAFTRASDGALVASSGNGALPPRPDASIPALRLAFDDIDASLLRRVAPELDTLVTKNTVRMVFQVNEGVVSTSTEARATASPRPHAVWATTAPRSAAWNAAVWHRAGSVEVAVASQRHRNLALSLGALGLLGASSALIYASARRARALAARQVDFVASVSHELRTPVAVIRSAADNLADGVVHEPQKAKQYGEVIRAEAHRLSDLVDQVLTFAGADSKDASKLEPFEAAWALRAALDELAAFAAARGAVVDVRDLAEGAKIRGDLKQVTRALRNLVENGLKYGGETPRVEAAVRREGNAVVYEISDNGPAWNEDEASRLFEPFFRGRAALESTVAGSGLGLALVRRIAESHRGSIDAARRPGGGARFTLRIPRA